MNRQITILPELNRLEKDNIRSDKINTLKQNAFCITYEFYEKRVTVCNRVPKVVVIALFRDLHFGYTSRYILHSRGT